MKKFNFPLNTVLNYKDQVLDNLKNEHAQIVDKVVRQEQKVEELSDRRNDACTRFKAEIGKGIAVNMMREYETYITFMQKKILTEQGVLQKLQRKEEQKREEVVEARKEVVSIEKLKEKKLLQYNKEVLRSEELFIEEFVSNTTSVHGSR
ncbi:flagellar export protein FliJ [Lacrimispora sphenoides]|uniref:Flagellar FliJ protein n=1 Tax=Lacrimispora sphenoides JCM 1415 TaxID=1297793 RepID=A0ABY1CCQ4_9FIRM|nr:flagellar export protein FliJ [Lacrimispora sphenoides]SET93780.1 flagellar FliJ protein [[Clostridium] sphenoides JCM 1415]SUY52524.1 flagellar export protein FliJ [Lacrimispora sphenoides]